MGRGNAEFEKVTIKNFDKGMPAVTLLCNVRFLYTKHVTCMAIHVLHIINIG